MKISSNPRAKSRPAKSHHRPAKPIHKHSKPGKTCPATPTPGATAPTLTTQCSTKDLLDRPWYHSTPTILMHQQRNSAEPATAFSDPHTVPIVRLVTPGAEGIRQALRVAPSPHLSRRVTVQSIDSTPRSNLRLRPTSPALSSTGSVSPR